MRYRVVRSAGCVARLRRLRRNPGIPRDLYIDAVAPRLALRLAGLRGVQSAGGSPGKAFTPQPGDTPGFIHRRGFPPARAALSRATGLCGLRAVARVRRLRRNPGILRDLYIDAVSPRLALRLAGLRGCAVCGLCSPGKAFTPQPGDTPGFIYRRGFSPARAALSRATGLCGLRAVARLRRLRRQPGILPPSYASSCSSHASARFTAFFQPL